MYLFLKLEKYFDPTENYYSRFWLKNKIIFLSMPIHFIFNEKQIFMGFFIKLLSCFCFMVIYKKNEILRRLKHSQILIKSFDFFNSFPDYLIHDVIKKNNLNIFKNNWMSSFKRWTIRLKKSIFVLTGCKC